MRFCVIYAFLEFLVLFILFRDVFPAQQYFVDLTQERLPSLLARSSRASFGDIDGDHDLDIFISNTETSDYPDLLFIHVAGDSFVDETSERLPSIGGDRNSFGNEMGDIDFDGDLDIVVANVGSDDLLLLNNGEGHFVLADTDRLPSDRDADGTDAKFGDMDADMDLDLIVTNFNWRDNYLYINNGLGYYSGPEYDRFPSGYYNSNALAFGDIDGDLDLDVIIANNTGQTNQAMINDGMGWFTDETSGRLPEDLNQSNGVALGDMDGDEDLDIVIGNGWFPSNDEIFINDGNGFFTNESSERLPPDNAQTAGVNVIDVDNDGDLDILFANYASGGVSTRLLINDGSGYFTDETSLRYPTIDEQDSDIDVADIDKDGDADIFVSNIGSYPEGGQNRLLINVSTPDSFPPVIPRTLALSDTVPSGNPYIITTTVWDNISIPFEQSVSLVHSIDDGEYTSISMRYCGGYLWREAIPEQEEGREVRYYVRALDLMSNETTDPPGAPDSVYSFVTGPVAIDKGEEEEKKLPLAFSLSQNYPNPFNPSTTISFDVPGNSGKPSHVTLVIYDIRGKLVKKLIDLDFNPGIQTAIWNGTDEHGQQVPSGLYFYRLRSGDLTTTKKMMLTR
jgi:hypothetical protein